MNPTIINTISHFLFMLFDFQTTPFLMCCLRCLADSPVVQERLREEIKAVEQKYSSLNADALVNMPYLRAVIKEAFR
jgi:cytochrome P450